jgi:hypothetical protein
MPLRYKIALGFLYSVFFTSLAALKLGLAVTHWAFAKFGLYPMVAGLAAYAMIPVGSVWLINKINRDWPALMLPPEPIFRVSDAVYEDEATIGQGAIQQAKSAAVASARQSGTGERIEQSATKRAAA